MKSNASVAAMFSSCMFNQLQARVQPAPETGMLSNKIIEKLHSLGPTTSNLFCVSAVLLHAPAEPRSVNVKDRKTSQTVSVPVATVILADHTEPITLELSHKSAE